MPDPVDKAKDVADAVAHPVDATKDLAAEVEAGRSARTPAIAIGGGTLIIGIVLAILVAVLLILYFTSGGK